MKNKREIRALYIAQVNLGRIITEPIGNWKDSTRKDLL